MSQHLPVPSGRGARTGRARTGPVRIGDTERDLAVAELSEHFVAGRLTQDEFEERSNQATRARYDDDLALLFDDLPDPAPSQPGPQRWSPGFRPGPQKFRAGPPPFLWVVPVVMVGLLVATIPFAAPVLLWVMFWIALFSGPHNPRRWQGPHRR